MLKFKQVKFWNWLSDPMSKIQYKKVSSAPQRLDNNRSLNLNPTLSHKNSLERKVKKNKTAGKMQKLIT